MQRAQLVLLAAIAILLLWVGLSRDTSAQAPMLQAASPRFSLVMSEPGANRIMLLDTWTGRVWELIGTQFMPVTGGAHGPNPGGGVGGAGGFGGGGAGGTGGGYGGGTGDGGAIIPQPR